MFIVADLATLNTKTLSNKLAYTTKTVLFFLLVNVIISATLVVIKTQLLLQMLTTIIFFKMADSTKLENKGLYKPMLYQFCIANNAA